jgi:hypothetical protein
MQIRYVGPFDVVEVPDLGRDDIKQGDTVDVPDELGERLLEQTDNWQPVKAPKPKPGDAGTTEER